MSQDRGVYRIVKRYDEICVGHRIHNASLRNGQPSHCAFLHGYARSVELTIAGSSLDHHTWLLNLGDLKMIKEMLEKEWDHRFLISDQDPLLADFLALQKKGGIDVNVMKSSLGHSPSLEGSCCHLADLFAPIILEASQGRCWLEKVEIWEKTSNRASITLPRPQEKN